MFNCLKCNEDRYIFYEEAIYICKDCNKIFRICCDCNIQDIRISNFNSIKKKYYKLFRFIINYKNYIKRLLKKKSIDNDCINLILNYCDKQYYFDLKNGITNINKFKYELLNIYSYGLQLIQDDYSNQFHTNPIFYCSECLKKYDYFSFRDYKLKE